MFEVKLDTVEEVHVLHPIAGVQKFDRKGFDEMFEYTTDEKTHVRIRQTIESEYRKKVDWIIERSKYVASMLITDDESKHTDTVKDNFNKMCHEFITLFKTTPEDFMQTFRMYVDMVRKRLEDGSLSN